MTEAPIPPPQPIAAVLADVDGTLVTSAKAVTERAIDAVGKLHERGVVFAITSGRPPRGMRMLVRPLELRGLIAAFNGGIIVQPDMTIVDERLIPAGLAPAVIDTISAHGLYPWIYRGAEWYVSRKAAATSATAAAASSAARMIPVDEPIRARPSDAVDGRPLASQCPTGPWWSRWTSCPQRAGQARRARYHPRWVMRCADRRASVLADDPAVSFPDQETACVQEENDR